MHTLFYRNGKPTRFNDIVMAASFLSFCVLLLCGGSWLMFVI